MAILASTAGFRPAPDFAFSYTHAWACASIVEVSIERQVGSQSIVERDAGGEEAERVERWERRPADVWNPWQADLRDASSERGEEEAK